LIPGGLFSAMLRYPKREIHKVFLRSGCLACRKTISPLGQALQSEFSIILNIEGKAPEVVDKKITRRQIPPGGYYNQKTSICQWIVFSL